MHKSCLSLLLAGTLAACSLEPRYQRPAAPVPQAWPNGPAYRIKPMGEPPGAPGSVPTASRAAADIGWQQFFVDPHLKQLIALALANNRDLRIAVLNIQKARAQYGIQRAVQFPTINASGGEISQRLPGSLRAPGQPALVNEYTAGIGFNAFELDFFGRVRSLKHAALQSYLATEAAQRSVQISLVAQVADAYLTLQADQALLKLAQDTLQSQQHASTLVSRSKRAGALANLDMQRVQTQVDSAQVAVERYTRQAAQDRNALQLLVGGPLPADLPQTGTFSEQPAFETLPAGLPSDLLERRPDIIEAEHRLEAANANIGAARAAFFPSITLTGALGLASTSLASLFSAGMAWTFAPQISVPIFDAGSNQAKLDVAKVQKRIEVATYEKAIQTAFREVADDLAARGTLTRQVAAQQDLVKAARKTYDLSNLRFRGGLDDYYIVLDSQRSLFSAQQDLITMRLAELTNQVNLYKALGGGWTAATPPLAAAPVVPPQPPAVTATTPATAPTMAPAAAIPPGAASPLQ
ncbi:MAG: efflux transporter outer membrane subunit [Burkholderiales bacterium]|nr:efflux transporter outer membrane subunit [Burkholderiales bacterium]